eukprot:1948212-Amphidinium_carterae.1
MLMTFPASLTLNFGSIQHCQKHPELAASWIKPKTAFDKTTTKPVPHMLNCVIPNPLCSTWQKLDVPALCVHPVREALNCHCPMLDLKDRFAIAVLRVHDSPLQFRSGRGERGADTWTKHETN